jgi:hypothetical protein
MGLCETLSITTLINMGLFQTLSMSDTQHNDNQHNDP